MASSEAARLERERVRESQRESERVKESQRERERERERELPPGASTHGLRAAAEIAHIPPPPGDPSESECDPPAEVSALPVPAPAE